MKSEATTSTTRRALIPVTLSDLASSNAIHSTAEAVTLVLAAMHACEEASSRCEQCFRLPDAAHIVLTSDGRVSFSTDLLEGTNAERVKHITLVLRQLLGVDSERTAHRAEVPGALMLLIARGSRHIDLPAPSYVALRDALIRFGSFNPAVLSLIYGRVAHGHEIHLTSFRRIIRNRAALAASVAAAAVAISVAVMWTHRLATGTQRPDFVTIQTVDVRVPTGTLQRPDFVTIQTVDVRVPIDAPIVAENLHNNATRPRHGQTPISLRPLLASAVLGADVFSPSFARQGQVLLFHSGRNRSALMRATFDRTGNPAVATLLRDGATNYHATVSPDGTRLSYDSDRDGTRAVYVAHSDASEPRKISGDGYAAVPRWSPDGRRLAFLKAESARPRVWNVWIADLATGSVSRVSRHNVGQAWGASWFPDGRQIAYSVEDKLVLANLDDGSIRVVQSPRRGHLIRTPAVSPDGHYVVFQVYRDGAWLLDVASGNMRRVLTDAAAEEFAWSPDGRRVVFHTKHNGDWSVWQLQLDPALVAG